MRAAHVSNRYCCESGGDLNGIIEKGFSRSILDSTIKRDHMVLGNGFYFAPDAKVADCVQVEFNSHMWMILCRSRGLFLLDMYLLARLCT